jgi:hypothetical protein
MSRFLVIQRQTRAVFGEIDVKPRARKRIGKHECQLTGQHGVIFFGALACLQIPGGEAKRRRKSGDKDRTSRLRRTSRKSAGAFGPEMVASTDWH